MLLRAGGFNLSDLTSSIENIYSEFHPTGAFDTPPTHSIVFFITLPLYT